MISSKLPPVLDISNLNSTEDIIEFIYENFQKEYTGPENIRYLHGEKVHFDYSRIHKDKFLFFWHLISLSSSEKFNVLPCNNDISLIKCSDHNCLTQNNYIELPKGKRNICFYRGIRVHWIGKIIELADKNDPFITQWEQDDNNCFYIRFQHETTDYLVVLTMKKNGFLFVTAYPLFYINKKQVCDKQYELYQASKTNKQSAANAEKN